MSNPPRRRFHRHTLLLRSSALAAGLGMVAGADVEGQDRDRAASPPSLTSAVLALDADRVSALLASGAAPAANLFEEALTLQVTGDEPADLVLIAYRLRLGRTLARYESEPFRADAGDAARLVERGAVLPDEAFFGGDARVAEDGIAEPLAMLPSDEAADDPVRGMSAVGGKPQDWTRREVIYVVAVPADETLRTGAAAAPVIVFGPDNQLESSSSSGGGDDVAEVFRRFREAQAAQYAWVHDYTVYQQSSVTGFLVPVHYERAETNDEAGQGTPGSGQPPGPDTDGGGYAELPVYRIVPPTEYSKRWYEEAGVDSTVFSGSTYETFAMGLDMLGDALSQELDREGVGQIGDAAKMGTSLMSFVMREAAAAADDDLMPVDADEQRADWARFEQLASKVGTETIDGHEATHMRADGLAVDVGEGYVLTAGSFWLDERLGVPLRMSMEVEGTGQDGETTGMAIEAEFSNYRQFGPIWVAMKQSYDLTGLEQVMSDEDRAKLEKAKQDLEKAKEQMANLPESVQKMALAQFEKAVKQLEAMSGEDGPSLFSSEEIVQWVDVNSGPPYPGGTGSFGVGGERFENALVVATWMELPPLDDVDYGKLIMFPASLEFRGSTANGTEGWLNVELGPRYITNKQPGFWNDQATGGGGLRRPDGSQWTFDLTTAASNEKGVRIWEVTPTAARGFVHAAGAYGSFEVGHQPCSGAPRGLSPSFQAEAMQWAAGDEEMHDSWKKACSEELERLREEGVIIPG